MKRRLFVQGTSIRKQVLRQRRIHSALADRWEALKTSVDNVRKDLGESKGPAMKPVRE